MNITELVELVRQPSAVIEFEQVMAVIDQHYDYSPAGFSNGDVMNEAGSNEGSCKLFAFAQLNGLSEMETLPLFGQHYRAVMDNPAGDDHANIRNFILDGWLGIHFDAEPLSQKA